MTPHAHELIADMVAGADDFWNEIVGVINETPGFDWRNLEAIRVRLESMRPDALEMPSEEAARKVFGMEYGDDLRLGLQGLILAYRWKLLANQLLKDVLQ